MKILRSSKLLFVMAMAVFPLACTSSRKAIRKNTAEPYRPAFHFTPKAHWMNDPNGMVFLNGTYHLFFQHNPDSTIWGPMHWGHAISTDLVHWQEQPIALYPDSLGTIFSGSAVVDENNTAGFGKHAIVAIFTHHNKKIEDQKTGRHQYQSLAYSTDEGKTWTKYQGNPVLPNPGIWDFRDPKVMWHAPSKKWVMTLATKDRITFYSSPNLKSWRKESEFGQELGAHGGVWECPDLFPLIYNGETHWVLLVSINPGGPNGGSATQYFTGDFDGKTFKPDSQKQKWMDYGADNYAGVTFSNTGERKILMGWMNNWNYANLVPTNAWRGATTLPHELSLSKIGQELYLASNPVQELKILAKKSSELKNIAGTREVDLSAYLKNGQGIRLEMLVNTPGDFSLELGDGNAQKLLLGYNHADNIYYIDRRMAGKSDFESGFANIHKGPRIGTSSSKKIIVYIDAASVELFADDGLTVMTDVFFPDHNNNVLRISGKENLKVSQILITGLP